jgi:hypothetical protein
MDDDVFPLSTLDRVDRGEGHSGWVIGSAEGVGQPCPEQGGIGLKMAQNHQGIEVITM